MTFFYETYLEISVDDDVDAIGPRGMLKKYDYIDYVLNQPSEVDYTGRRNFSEGDWLELEWKKDPENDAERGELGFYKIVKILNLKQEKIYFVSKLY